MRIKLKLHRNPDRTKIKATFDTQKLETEIFRSKFSVELRNRFEVLEVEENINEDCIQVVKVYTETAEKVLDRKKEKQALVERGHLESNRTAAENP